MLTPAWRRDVKWFSCPGTGVEQEPTVSVGLGTHWPSSAGKPWTRKQGDQGMAMETQEQTVTRLWVGKDGL